MEPNTKSNIGMCLLVAMAASKMKDKVLLRSVSRMLDKLKVRPDAKLTSEEWLKETSVKNRVVTDYESLFYHLYLLNAFETPGTGSLVVIGFEKMVKKLQKDADLRSYTEERMVELTSELFPN